MTYSAAAAAAKLVSGWYEPEHWSEVQTRAEKALYEALQEAYDAGGNRMIEHYRETMEARMTELKLKLGEAVLATLGEPVRELYVFKAKPGVWLSHPNKDETGNCFGRIVRLYYPWKWDTIYCDRDCCKMTDPETIMEAGHYGPDKPEFVRHIAGTVTHFDPVPMGPPLNDPGLFWCMDCGRIGTREEVPA